MWACHVKTSHDIVLVDRPSIFVDCFANYQTIVVKNAQDEVVLIFSINVISQIMQNGASVNVSISLSPNERVLYEFGFIDDLDASALKELLNRLSRDTGDTSAPINRRPFRDAFVEGLFRRLEQQIRDRIND